jgi:hypothetical protein
MDFRVDEGYHWPFLSFAMKISYNFARPFFLRKSSINFSWAGMLLLYYFKNKSTFHKFTNLKASALTMS